VALGFQPPPVDHRGESFRFGRGEVVALRRVLGHVVQLPLDVIEAGLSDHHRVEGDRLPAVVVERTASEHLEVLGGPAARRVGRVERRREARSFDRLLRNLGEVRRRIETEHVEHGGDEIDRVHVLVPHLAPDGDPTRPVDDERIGDATLVHLTLPPLERGVARDRPSPRVVVWSRGPPISSMRSNASRTGRPARFHGRTSFTDPVSPPSDDAPLSDTSITIVLSRSPVSASASSNRPSW